MQIYSEELKLPDLDHLKIQFSAGLRSSFMALLFQCLEQEGIWSMTVIPVLITV